MRWLRFIITLLKAKARSRLTINDTSQLQFRVWLTDIDLSIMNHAAMLSAMEMGRIDLMVRTGFLKLARKHHWYFPSSSLSVQFFRPLKLFQRATLLTTVFHVNEKWIYLEQKLVRKGKTVAICIVKSTIKKGREQINIYDVLKQLNLGEAPSKAPDLIEQIEQGNALAKERLY